MMIIHLLLQYSMMILWSYIIYYTISFRKTLTLNFFVIMLMIEILIVYIMGTDLFIFKENDNIIWERIEWYPLDVLIAVFFIMVINMTRSNYEFVNKFIKK